jgi:SUMO ligase MMS21 Smc5/6 complex component
MEGGTSFFEKAQAIVNNSQNAREKGWKAFESERNRYWLTENILNKSYSDYRKCMYTYHRQGLDLLVQKTEEGRANIAESLRDIQKVFRRRPSVYILQMFFDAKSDELVNVFSKSFPDERNRVLAILNEVDPSNGSKYKKISDNQDL